MPIDYTRSLIYHSKLSLEYRSKQFLFVFKEFELEFGKRLMACSESSRLRKNKSLASEGAGEGDAATSANDMLWLNAGQWVTK